MRPEAMGLRRHDGPQCYADAEKVTYAYMTAMTRLLWQGCSGLAGVGCDPIRVLRVKIITC